MVFRKALNNFKFHFYVKHELQQRVRALVSFKSAFTNINQTLMKSKRQCTKHKTTPEI